MMRINDIGDELGDKKKNNIILEGVCYVLIRSYTLGRKVNPITNLRHDLVWYPENAMTLYETVAYRPFVKSIVTENPWLIACYPCEKVRVWRDRRWTTPNVQTYCASIEHIYRSILRIPHSTPAMPLDGGRMIAKVLKEIEQES